jgi:nucleoside-diphosphate-sugar epimerase
MHALVTGGGGFLGSGITNALLKQGNEVSIIGRGHYPHLSPSVKRLQGDIRDLEFVNNSLKKVDVVFHTAAIPGIWGRDFFSINVQGTENLIKACRKNSVQKLVFTSSPSVVFGRSSLEDADESTPYPEKYLCEYPRTKALAEKMVLQANDARLATVAIRPHLIWGPGDPHLVPRLIDKAKKNKLIRVGEGKNQVDIIYIDNAVSAHLKACEALAINGNVAGKAYFVSDGEPVILWDWINDLLGRLGRPNVSRSISFSAAMTLGTCLEGVYGILRIKREPPMTRFLASQLATSHYFNISKAKNDFGYTPLVSHEEGMNRLIRSYNFSPQEG